ncbi:MAG TPA: hypothetical protein VFX98_01530 [Longimicrobiaceae bacterium]|nr:hypothetical protein [Longimicrobiaceae bacterium]
MPRRRAALTSAASLLLAGATLGLAAPHRSLPPLTWSILEGPPSTRRVVGNGEAAFARLAEHAFGRSGKLRVAVADPWRPLGLPLLWDQASQPAEVSYRWLPLHGTRPLALLGEDRLAVGLRAPAHAGIWKLQLRGPDWLQEVNELSVITRVPFSEKRGGYLNGYRIGWYATETEGRTDQYAPPPGFIEVTPENQDLRVSEHFSLRNFLTKDQFSVWPKYLALDLRLIDKLELVLQELNAMGIRAEHLAIMSGFRTPAYNGPGEGGRARLSRHTYGDASDVWVDNDRDGYMDDLNGDGRRDTGDAVMMLRAVERVERRYPELVGGAGVYPDNGAHGPFIHIDARGYRSRW